MFDSPRCHLTTLAMGLVSRIQARMLTTIQLTIPPYSAEFEVVLIVTLIPATYPIRHAFYKRTTIYPTTRSRSGHVHLSGDELGPGIRGDHKSAYKGRSYVEHELDQPGGSTSNLPLNDILRKQDIQIKREYTTAHIVEMPTTSNSHSRSRSSDLQHESYLEDE